MWLQCKDGKGEPYNFPCYWKITSENGPPAKLRFARRSVYDGFRRLKEKGLIRWVEGKMLTYELVRPDEVYAQVMELWQKVHPPKPGLPSESRRLHKDLKESLEKAVEHYEGLPGDWKKDLNNSIVEDHILDMPFKGAVSTREMLTVEEAKALEKKARHLLDQVQFVDHEKKWRMVPYSVRARHKQTIETSSYKGASKIPPGEHPMCLNCGVRTVFAHELGVYTCPKCGLQVVEAL